MAPSTILIVGATGNTGQSAVSMLSALLLAASKDTRILGLTRSLTSDASKQLDLLPNVEMMEKNWTTIDAAWLQEQGVVRAYVASHNLPSQFTDESRLYVAMLQAGVQYVVRISTMTQYVSSTNIVDYGRQHWAVESLLSQPVFAGLQWTSLQPHVFLNFCLNFADDWLKTYRTTGEQTPLEVMISADQPVAAIDPQDVGDVGAHLLALEDPSTHNGAKYVMTGPEDITGKQVVAMFEEAIGIKVNTVNYESTKKVDYSMEIGIFPKVAKASFAASLGFICRGECSLAGPRTSEAVMELAPPKRTAKQALDAILSK